MTDDDRSFDRYGDELPKTTEEGNHTRTTQNTLLDSRRQTNGKLVSRRSALKKLGIAGFTGLAASSAASATPGKAPEEPSQVLKPDTSGFSNLHEIVIKLYDDEAVDVSMRGVRPADATNARGYRVRLENAYRGTGEERTFAPARAAPVITPIPASELPDGTDSDSGEAETASADSQDVDTMNNVSPTQDYEGGVFGRTRDPPNFELCYTEQRANWTSSGGSTDHISGWHNGEAYTVYVGDTADPDGPGYSIWHRDDLNHEFTWPSDQVRYKVVANYYNDTWSWDHNRTWADHTLYLWGLPDGSMEWATSYSHSGEDSGLLSFESGYFETDGGKP